jgi:hypothetical protein
VYFAIIILYIALKRITHLKFFTSDTTYLNFLCLRLLKQSNSFLICLNILQIPNNNDMEKTFDLQKDRALKLCVLKELP